MFILDRILLTAAALTIALPALAQRPPLPTLLAPLTAGRSTVAWNADNGFSLSVDGVPVVRKSSLYLVKEGWSGVLLDGRKVAPIITNWATSPDGSRTGTAVQENENATCTYTITVAPDGTKITVDLSYALKTAVPAEVEYAAAYLSGSVLQGSAFTAASSAAADSSSRKVPVAPPAPGKTQPQNRLVAGTFDRLSFQTRLGDLAISFSGTAPKPVIFDARSEDQDWASEFPVFWMGIGSPEQPVAFADGARHATFTYSIDSAAPVRNTVAQRPPALPVSAPSVQRSVYAPALPSVPLLLPRPKEVSFPRNASPFQLNAKTRVVRLDDTDGTKRAALLLQQTIAEQRHLRLSVIDVVTLLKNENADAARNTILIGRAGAPGVSAKVIRVPEKPEGYGVKVGVNQQVLIAGRDDAGTLWGVQTLIQLLATDEKGPFIRPADVFDWPTLSVRAVHLFHGKNALPFQEKLIDSVLARYKMNALFLQAEQARWDTDPVVAPEWGGRKEDLRTEVAYARARGMTLYPLLQSYGHMEWLFSKDSNREYAEDPETPYAVNFTNPKAVQYLEKFNAEADTLFGAPGFHVGMDEVTMRGRFPYRSQPREFADLYVSAANHWHDFFRARGKEMWMWADMAIYPTDADPDFGTAPSPEAAAKVRAGLPKDIVMVDWQYGGRDNFPSLKLLKDAGFTKVIAATWFNPANIQGFSKTAADVGALGAMYTTWAGYESSEKTALSAPSSRRQFTAMVLAADYFWNGGAGPAPDKLAYDPAGVFAQQWYNTAEATDYRHRDGAFLTVPGTAPISDWLGYGEENSPAALPTESDRFPDGIRYRIPSNIALLGGKLTGPRPALPSTVTVTVPGKRKVRDIRLLLTASHRVPAGTKIGTLSVQRTDGSTENRDLIYGQNIAAWDDDLPLLEARTVWTGKTRAGQPFYLRRLTVSGEAAAIRSVTLTSAGTEAAPALFSATALY